MRGSWRNDRLFARLAYGLGGPSPHEIVHEQPEIYDPIQPRVQPQPVQYPSMRDYNAPDNLTLDHNQKMPYHEGDLGTNLKELTNDVRQDAPLSQHNLWDESYSDGVHMGQRQPWIAIDLDGTILEKPPPDLDLPPDMQPPLGPPKPGAVEAIGNLAQLGWRISIYTARFGDEQLDDETIQRWSDEIARHLENAGIPFSDIWVGRKPRADFFVDDKAIRFDGDWAAILGELTLVDSPPGPEESTTEVEGNWSNQTESGNDLIDPWGGRMDRDMPRPPDLEEALYG